MVSRRLSARHFRLRVACSSNAFHDFRLVAPEAERNQFARSADVSDDWHSAAVDIGEEQWRITRLRHQRRHLIFGTDFTRDSPQTSLVSEQVDEFTQVHVAPPKAVSYAV